MEQLNLRYTINSNGSITTSWDDIPGTVRYHAYMYIKGKGTIYNETNLTTTSYTSRSDLDANEFYQVTVTAYGASSSLASDGARILIPSDFYSNVPLGIPQNIEEVANAASVTISFDKVVRATGYDILLNGTVYSLTSSLSRVSKVINGLTPKTSYSYSVRAKNSSKTGEYSAVRTFTTPAVSPAAPTGITKSVTQNSVTISWNPVDTATRYEIIFNGYTYSVNATSKTFTGLHPGTEYRFKIRGNNSDAQGIYSNEISVTTAPQTPAGISAVSTDTTITINWNAVPGAANYFVYFMNQDIAVKGTDTCTTFTNLTPNTAYTYKVCASSVDGRSPYSTEMTVKTTPPGPSMPGEITQNSTEDSVTLSWDAVNGATSYDVMFDGQTYHVTRNTITINSLAANTSYTYRVRANNANGSSEYGASKTVKTAPAAPSAPSGSATKNSATISWAAVPGATSYDLLFNGTTYRVTGTSKTIEGLAAGQSYSYQIRANNADGSGSYGPLKTISTIPNAPGRVGSVSAKADTESVNITWSAVSGADSYDVLFGNTIYEASGTSITINGLQPYTQYTYQVRGKNAGGAGSYSVAGEIRTLMKAPDNITATATKNSVTLSWSASSGATSYDVLFNGKTTLGIKTTSYTITGLTKGTAYSYSICARNSLTSSAYSPTATVMTIPDPPEMPANVKAIADANSITVSWSAAARAAGYDVYLAGRTYDATETKTTITGLHSNTSYTYQVRAKNAGGTSAYSASQSITTLLETPKNITLTVSRDNIVAKWGSVSGANRYEVSFNGNTSIIYGTSKVFSSLTPGTNYTFAIKALGTSNNSEYSEIQTVRTIPNAPTVPTNIKATVTAESASITWSAVSGADSYEVVFNNKTYSTQTPSITITGLTANTSYTYKVRAKNTGGTSSYSASQTIKTLEKIPETPVNVRATSTSYTITVSWNSTPWASSYDVIIGGTTYNVTGTSATRTGLAANSSYTYQVRAKNSAGTSAYSAAQTIKTLVAPPATPSNVSATSTTNSVTVKWNAVSGATSYDVSFNGSTYAVTTGTTRTFTGLTMGTNYSYAVRARNAGGPGAYSATKTIQTVPVVPPVPTNVTASAKADSVTVSWKKVGGAASYDVLFNNVVYNVTGISKTITGLNANTSYEYAVRAKNSAGTGAYSETKTVRTLLPVPENIQAIATSDMVLLSWDEVIGASVYDINFNGSAYEAGTPYIEFTELASETEYTFSIRARNDMVAGEYSKEDKVQTMIRLPQIPENVTASSTINSITVSWDAAEGAESYDVLFDGEKVSVASETEESARMRIAARTVRQSSSRLARSFFGLEPNTEHTYCVRAGNRGGFSEYSPLGTIRTQMNEESTLPAGKAHKTYPDGKIPQLGLEPVDPLTGAFLWSYTFLNSYGKDNLHFTMMYNSQGEVPAKILGNKWTYSLNYFLYMDSGYAYFGTPYGEFVSFLRGEDSTFQPTESSQTGYSMSREEDGTYHIREIDGTEYVFHENLSLARIVEGGLAAYRFHSDEEGRIILVEGRHGGILTFAYEGEHISSVTDVMGNTLRFTYNDGRLISAADPAGNSISFSYDDHDWLLKITDLSGMPYLANQYDTFGRVAVQNITGRGNSFASYDTVGRVTTFTDELGNETKYYYDENRRVTKVEQGGTGVQNSYNEKGQLTQQTDALGNTTQMLYDEYGRMNCVIHPDGTREQISYNKAGYPVSLTGRDGAESLYSYDERNNLISAQNERGFECTYAYDDEDNLISYTDKEGNVWTYAYDENNYLKQAEDPEGNLYRYSHDMAGRLTSYTTPEGRETSYQYSETGDLLRITDGAGSILFEYDSNGNRTAVIDKKGGRQQMKYNELGQVQSASDFMGNEYSFAYDEKGRLVKETDPLGYSVSYAYDAVGNRISQTDKNGGTTSFTFDGANQLTKVRNAAGGTVTYSYDTMGQVKTVTDPLDHQTAYTYDPAGRVTKITNALGHSVSYTYDPAGNLLTKTDEEGAVTSYTYDKENRLLSIRTEAGTTGFAYDKLGRLVSVLDTEGHREQGAYNGDGSLTTLTDKEGRQTTYAYDSAGRLAEETAPDGGRTAYAYDQNSNCIQITDAEGNEYAYAYDADNRLVKTTDPTGQETCYAYDGRGQLISVTDARGGKTSYTYDGNGNLTREINPLGGEKTYEYDSAGRLTKSTDEEGNQSSYAYDDAGNLISYTDGNQNIWSYAYDAGNRLISVTDQNEDCLSYEYTNTGRVSRVTDKEGAETAYRYDSMGRLLGMQDALGHETSFTYDSLGRMLTLTDAGGNTTEYEYSPSGNILSIKDPEGGITSYTYDGAGRVLTKTNALGNTESYEYDALGRVAVVTDVLGGRTSFTYTPAGQIATVTGPEGGITRYSYDGNGNLIRRMDPLGTVTEYEYDAMNNQIRECLTASGEQTCATLYQYDKKGRMIREISPLQEEKSYTYDGNGNLTAILDEDQNQTTVRYDLNNLPVFMGYGDGKEAFFRYNKRGELVEIRDWTGTSAMERDVLGRLTKVTDPEGRSAGYAYDAAGNLAQTVYPDGSVASYTYDRNRRLTQVTDAEGKTARYAYDPAGRLTALIQPGSRSSYTYNAAGLPTYAGYQLEDGTALEEQLTYNLSGRITATERRGISPALTAAAAYTYDPAGRLLTCTQGQTTESYTYDPLGNRTTRKVNNVLKAAYTYNAANQLTAMTENGKEHTYRYDRRGNLTEEQKAGIPIRRYTYDATGRMVMGANLENGEKTRYTYNALYMRTARHQTLTGKENYYTKETSYLPDYQSASNNDLMAYEKGFGATRTIYGRAYERLSQKVTSGEVGTGPEGNGTGAALPVNRMPASTETLTPEAMIGASVIGKTYFQPDLYGSPLFASNEQGQVLRYAERNIWGDLKLPIHNDLNLSGLEDSLRFTSYVYDPAIGTCFAQARFYDSSKGRMLSKDPIKRGLNGYHYCDDDPVNYVDPTGEIVNVLAGGVLGGLVGGTFGFVNSAASQLFSGEKFSYRKAWGAAANGAVVGAAKGAAVSSGVGIPLALAADFTAGSVGSALEQWITEGDVSVIKSIANGIINVGNSVIYGNNPLQSLKEAAIKGAKSGAFTSGVKYFESLLEPQHNAVRSPGIEYQGGADGLLIPRDPKRGCGTPDLTIGSLNYGKDYGYQYHVPSAEETTQRGRRFSLIDFIKETMTGAVTGGLASATFYGAGKAVEALKESIKSSRAASNLNEEIYTRYMADGSTVTDVSHLPGSEGIKIPKRLNVNEMTYLTKEYGVEFAQVYQRGPGVNGGGGTYFLYSGDVRSVRIPVRKDIMLINHTHPSGTAYPSGADKKLLSYLEQVGSPQRISEIIPIGKLQTIKFGVGGIK